MSGRDILRPWCSVLVVVRILASRGDCFNKPPSIYFRCVVIQQLKQFNWLRLLCFNWRIWKLQLSMQVTVNQIILKSRKYCMGGNALKPWCLQCLRENQKFGGNCLVSFLATAFCFKFIDKFKTQDIGLTFTFCRRFYGRLSAAQYREAKFWKTLTSSSPSIHIR